ncbi:hypothetical protein T06_13815 [Trichinella sp. T6]|nr:hypothetical protein T06_13815 [Trichinella sp. T6]
MVIHAGRCHPVGVKTLIVKEKRENLHQPVPGPGKMEALQPTGTGRYCKKTMTLLILYDLKLQLDGRLIITRATAHRMRTTSRQHLFLLFHNFLLPEI